MQTNVSYIRTSDHLTITFDDGVTATVYPSQAKFDVVIKALRDKNYALARSAALPVEQVKAQFHNVFGMTEQQVTIEHGIVRYEGKEMDNTLTRRMLQMLEEGFDVAPLKLFLINLQRNPSFRAVNELYGFLEKGNLPITEDGYFLAYKKVRADFKDVHSGTFDNSVGKVVQMPRNEVDENSRNECSSGLHFCSKDYLSAFTGEHTMIVKIDPADVVAIPADYNSSKGRTCRYEVIGELEKEGKLEGSFRDTGTRPSLKVDIFHIEDEEEEDDNDDNELSSLNSSFTGIPAEDSVSIPRSVALEIASSLDEEVLSHSQIEADDTYGNKFYYVTIREAAEDTDTNASSISKCLNGQRKTAGGFIWKRVVNG